MLWARYQNYLRQNSKNNAFGFSIALLAAGVILLVSGLFGTFTGVSETYEELYLLFGCTFSILGMAGSGLLRNREIIAPKALLSSSMIGLGSFIAIIYFAFWMSQEFGALDDVLLEATSAFTVTNLSLIKNPQDLGQGLLVLRSLTQWVGGLGAIFFFSNLLPSFVRSKSRDYDHATHKFNSLKNFKATLGIYVGATALIMVGYVLAGMSWFDGVTHSWATISTGGFSNYTNGLQHFDSVAIEWIASIGMLVGGVRLILFFWALRGAPGTLWRSLEVRIYALVIFVATVFLILGDGDGIRRSFFSAISAISGTGFRLENWSEFSFGLQVMLLMLIATGTMSGTPAGGFGLTRAIEAVQYIYRELYIQLHPKALFRVKMGKHILGESGLSQTQTFQFFYLGALVTGIFLLAQFGADTISAIGGAITAFASMGPSIGEYFVDAESLGSLPRPARGVLSAMMLIGRVSIFPIMILLFSFWERLRTGVKFSFYKRVRAR